METQRVQMKGVLPWLGRWARRAGAGDFYPALAALVNPAHCFNLCGPIARTTWAWAVVQGRLSLNVCLRFRQEEQEKNEEHS
jgi:hypothetical protein